MNESYAQPPLPPGAEDGVMRGLYRFGSRARDGAAPAIRLIGSGAILREVIAAADLLVDDWGVSSEIFSATSFAELSRDARGVERWNRLHPTAAPRRSHLDDMLGGTSPVVAATDYVRAYPQLIAPYLAGRFVALGTDGFGRSDTRAALRSFFEVDRRHVAVAALHELARTGTIASATVADAIARYGIDPDVAASWTV
jgi:pyruvate dehydrogenase E1 component